MYDYRVKNLGYSSTYFPVNVKYFKPHVVDIIEY